MVQNLESPRLSGRVDNPASMILYITAVELNWVTSLSVLL